LGKCQNCPPIEKKLEKGLQAWFGVVKNPRKGRKKTEKRHTGAQLDRHHLLYSRKNRAPGGRSSWSRQGLEPQFGNNLVSVGGNNDAGAGREWWDSEKGKKRRRTNGEKTPPFNKKKNIQGPGGRGIIDPKKKTRENKPRHGVVSRNVLEAFNTRRFPMRADN